MNYSKLTRFLVVLIIVDTLSAICLITIGMAPKKDDAITIIESEATETAEATITEKDISNSMPQITFAEAYLAGYRMGYTLDKELNFVCYRATDPDGVVYYISDSEELYKQYGTKALSLYKRPKSQETIVETTEKEEQPEPDKYGTLLSDPEYSFIIEDPILSHPEEIELGDAGYLYAPSIGLGTKLTYTDDWQNDGLANRTMCSGDKNTVLEFRDHVHQGFDKIKNSIAGETEFFLVTKYNGQVTVKKYVCVATDIGYYGKYNRYMSSTGVSLADMYPLSESNMHLCTCHEGGLFVVYCLEDKTFTREIRTR